MKGSYSPNNASQDKAHVKCLLSCPGCLLPCRQILPLYSTIVIDDCDLSPRRFCIVTKVRRGSIALRREGCNFGSVMEYAELDHRPSVSKDIAIGSQSFERLLRAHEANQRHLCIGPCRLIIDRFLRRGNLEVVEERGCGHEYCGQMITHIWEWTAYSWIFVTFPK